MIGQHITLRHKTYSPEKDITATVQPGTGHRAPGTAHRAPGTGPGTYYSNESHNRKKMASCYLLVLQSATDHEFSNSQKSRAIYKASCWDCNDFYIGKTKGRLHDRKTEHFQGPR